MIYSLHHFSSFQGSNKARPTDFERLIQLNCTKQSSSLLYPVVLNGELANYNVSKSISNNFPTFPRTAPFVRRRKRTVFNYLDYILSFILQCGHSNHERYRLYFHFICTFFSLILVVFLIFFQNLPITFVNQRNGTGIFSPFFSVFLSVHGTRLRRFSVRGYTCIPNNVGVFFFLAGINLRSLKLDSGFQFTAKWPTLQQIIPVSTAFI